MKILNIIVAFSTVLLFSCTSDNHANPLQSKLKGKWKCVVFGGDPYIETNGYSIEFLTGSNFVTQPNNQSGHYSISIDSILHYKFDDPPQNEFFKKITRVTNDSLYYYDMGCIEGCPDIYVKVNP